MDDRPERRPEAQIDWADLPGGFRALVELLPDAVFVILDGYHAFANARGLQLLGAESLARLRCQPAQSYMHPDCRRDAEIRLHTMVDEGAPLGYVEERLVRLDGRVVEIEAAGAPLEIGDRRAALVVVRDITARKRAQAALRAAQERFRAAFDHAPTAILLMDATGTVMDANPAVGRLLQRAPAQLIGTSGWQLAAPEHRAGVRDWLAALAAGTSTRVSGDFRYLRPGGTRGWVHGRAARLGAERLFILHLMDVTGAREQEQALAARASTDPLTGLANRRHVLDRLQLALDGEARVAVLFCDLDAFKQVNDTFGHSLGDEVLVIAARRMRAVVPSADLVGRIGGDEFAVVLAGPGCEQIAGRVAERIREAIAAPMVVGGRELQVGVSIGIATTDEHPEGHAPGLLACADAAMYRMKAAGRERLPTQRLPA